MARKFLYGVAVLVFMAIAALFAFRLFGPQLMRMAMVPGIDYEALPPVAANAYADARRWIARPDKPGNPALWTPQGYAPAADPRAAVFFVHPTSYLDRSHWNAPLDDARGNDLAATFVRGQASVFNGTGAIWAPAYRQATFGAFLTDAAAANQALDLAYGDVRAAFDTFLVQAGDRPIILAGHSQGSLHLLRLLKERVAGQPVARRIVAVYLAGWPVSRTADLPALGLPECTRADQAGCILSWQSFGEPADPSMVTDVFDAGAGLTGQARRGTAMICTNPLTGTPDSAAPASANLGTLYPSADLKTATIAAGRIPARCAGRGLLLIGAAPTDLQQFVLPGNNYHVFDYSLFWANLRADSAKRLAAFTATPPAP
ncbi:DUF3089 domain-containing protein [Sphingomonas sp.]|uniref:DUF3089 domain-containing protein n=1 Tax=Sphingomonas sp. TaxID=28214 RepID=UPI001D3181FE|nr:DUF3089 domain-containing protein [Sphingomonas sp.]MBX9795890.1 DUF3089 domain-containing protein [Sphingomonas sp.]